MKRDRMKTVDDFLKWESLLCSAQKAILQGIQPPKRIGRSQIPSDLNSLKFEDLCKFWSVTTPKELFDVTAQVLLGRKDARGLDLYHFLGVTNMVVSELERITALWNDIPNSHSPEEIMAGCGSLKFGVFGIMDWYARRMGITNHDEVAQTPWVRIYQCMKNDAEEAQYRKRLNDIISKKK